MAWWLIKIWIFVKLLPALIMGGIMAAITANLLWDFFTTLMAR